MKYFFESITRPYIKDANYKNILEVGASFGKNSNELLSIEGIHLTIIDPCVDDNLLDKFGSNKQITVMKGLSLEMLPKLTEPFDCIFIDGDHNWYTVTNELILIEERNLLKENGTVFIHDVFWPYGRRDMYYMPESIPEEFRHPNTKRGMIKGQSQLVENAGLNQDLFNATFEGGNRNGVLTAIEDFLRKYYSKYIFFFIKKQYGLGILVKKKNIATFLMCLNWRIKIYVTMKLDRCIYFLKKLRWWCIRLGNSD